MIIWLISLLILDFLWYKKNWILVRNVDRGALANKKYRPLIWKWQFGYETHWSGLVYILKMLLLSTSVSFLVNLFLD
jgi:hypothetical protein